MSDKCRRYGIINTGNTMSEYKPQLDLNEEILTLTAEIAELVGVLSFNNSLTTNPRLRRINRIKTIYSSLAIEQNVLSLDNVTDIIDGKRVLGPQDDIIEVKNAYDIYNQLDKLNPYSIKDLLKAHKVMMKDLIKEAGRFRKGNVGVFAGDKLIHAGTPAAYVPDVMDDLFKWLKESDLHPLIKSCVFHYEFESIHPFADGNGRLGRLWHTLILSKWKELFAWVPIESIIHEHQQEYYNALGKSNLENTINTFVVFMLKIIKETLLQLQSDVGESVGDNVGEILSLLKGKPTISAKDIASKIGLSSRQVERIIKRLREEGKIVRVGSARSGYWKVK